MAQETGSLLNFFRLPPPRQRSLMSAAVRRVAAACPRLQRLLWPQNVLEPRDIAAVLQTRECPCLLVAAASCLLSETGAFQCCCRLLGYSRLTCVVVEHVKRLAERLLLI